MSAAATHQLKHPVEATFKGPDGERQETISELSLRRIKGKDLKKVEHIAGEASQALALIGVLSGQPAAVCDELDAEDIAELGTIIEGFLPPGLLTGKTPSAT